MRRRLVLGVSVLVLGCVPPAVVGSADALRKAGGRSPGHVCPLLPGTTRHEIQVDGVSRSYWLTVGPEAGRAGKAPLVFLWHGWGGRARQLASVFDPAQVWPEAVTVTPFGLRRRFPGLPPGKMPGWQITAGEFGDRDLKLFDVLEGRMTGLSCIDASRLYSMGFSNGGFFSNLLGCQRSDVVAAIVPVSGGGPHPPTCKGPVAVQVVHGKWDRVVKYDEGKSSFETWQRINGCEAAAADVAEGCVNAGGCSSEVRMCSFDGGHMWPRDLNGEFVNFLKRHRSPARGAKTASE